MYPNTSLGQVVVLDPKMNYLANGRQYVAISDDHFNDANDFTVSHCHNKTNNSNITKRLYEDLNE